MQAKHGKARRQPALLKQVKGHHREYKKGAQPIQRRDPALKRERRALFVPRDYALHKHPGRPYSTRVHLYIVLVLVCWMVSAFSR